jgi:tripartite motif-containing protein 71
VMNSQWNAIKLNNLIWLNFSTRANQTVLNANFRVYRASGWEVLARSPNDDPRDGQRKNLARRFRIPELQAVAPRGDDAPSIELPTSEARAALQVIWVDPPLKGAAPSVPAYQPVVTSLSGDMILYPEAARLVASVAKEDALIAKADVATQVTRPDGTTMPLAFRDDGVSPDALADDGLYSAILPYTQPGEYRVDVSFANTSGHAEFTYRNRHYTPDPEGNSYDPAPRPVGEAFNLQATTSVRVSGFRQGFAGDQDVYTFTATSDGQLVLRVTDLALDMRPRIKLYRGATLVGDWTPQPNENGYFFTKIGAQAGESFRVEIAHADPQATEGLYNVSVGPPLARTIETAHLLFLPLIGK